MGLIDDELRRKADFEANMFAALVVLAVCTLVAGGYLLLS